MKKQIIFLGAFLFMSSAFASSSHLLEEELAEEISELQDRDLEAQQHVLEVHGEENPFRSLVDFFGEA